MTDLSLVPLDDLVNEIERRTQTFVCAYSVNDPQDKENDYFYYGTGTRGKAVQLGADLLNDVQNNWRGELRTLQRINDEGLI